MDPKKLNEKIPAVVTRLVDSVLSDSRMQHLNRVYLPNREAVIQCIQKLQEIVFPGYFGKQGMTQENITYRIGELLSELSDILLEQVLCSLRYKRQVPNQGSNDEQSVMCDNEAPGIVGDFIQRIPNVRELLAEDVQAAFDSDPAAQGTDETILCYPGLFAIFVQRFAHMLYEKGVPLLPRIMTEYAHSLTGIDIHPGAKLGKRLFIDHGTGVVIGETTEIGDNVKIYQGVTLGALAPDFGQKLRGAKRHPTIQDDVVIYAGATILGGETVIGKGSVIGGNVFLTSSVPQANRVTTEPPKLLYKNRGAKGKNVVLDFQI